MRLQAPGLRASFVRCFFYDLSWCVVAAAVSWAAGLSLQVVGAGPPMRPAPGGAACLALLLEERHLDALAQDDRQAAGYPGREAADGEWLNW